MKEKLDKIFELLKENSLRITKSREAVAYVLVTSEDKYLSSEDIHQKNVRHTNSCYFTMVSVDDEKKPMAAPKLELENDFEKKLFEAAKMRKELRNEIVKRNKDITSDIPDYNSDLMGDNES